MESSFLFVDGARPDRDAKRQMRRHVMKGKNAGKTLQRQSRLELDPKRKTQTRVLDLAPSPFRASAASTRTIHHFHDNRLRETVSGKFGDEFRAFGVPVRISAEGAKIINDFFHLTAERMYPVKLGLSLDDAKFMWLKALFEDETAYSCNIAMMKASNEVFLGGGHNSPTMLKSLSQTFAQVKKRLQSPHALSDSTMIIVISLINQEQIQKDRSDTKVHLEGLRRMVELRGGLDQLRHNMPLLLKVCKSDIMFAFQFGGPTIFFRNRIADVEEVLATKGFILDRVSAAVTVRHSELNDDLMDVLLDAMAISSLFNYNLGKFSLDLCMFQDMLLSISYRLLRFQTLGSRRQLSDLDSIYHTGLITFTMSTFMQHDSRRILDCSLITRVLRDNFSIHLGEHEDPLSLWLLMMGGIWMLEQSDGDWLSRIVMRTAKRLDLQSWDDVRECMRPFPWIDALHNEPGQKLWNRIWRNSLDQ